MVAIDHVALSQCYQPMTANDAQSYDRFGYAAAMSGDYAIIGAPGKGSNHPDPNTGFGAAYIYHRENGAWVQQAILLPSNTHSLQKFGISVATDGTYAAVGAVEDADINHVGGSVFIFKRNGTTWTQTAKIWDLDFASSDFFGQSVSISGDAILVGAFRTEENLGDNETGSAYVFRKQTTGEQWIQEAKLLAMDGASGDWFGYSVALSGDTAIIGAPRDNPIGPGTQYFSYGAAYAFVRQGGVWMQQAKLLNDYPLPPDDFTGLMYGWSVAVDGDRALIGANGEYGRKGSAYVFERSGTVWTQTARLAPNQPHFDDFFGASVALKGNVAMVGANYRDSVSPPANDSGAVFAFKRYANGWLQTHEIFSQMPNSDARLGTSVAVDGDYAIGGSMQDNAAVAVGGAAFSIAIDGPDCPGDNRWLLGNSGDFNDSFNWFPKRPGPLNSALFDAPGSYSVHFDSDVETSNIKVSAGDVSFDLDGRVYQTNTFIGPSLVVAAPQNSPPASLAIGNEFGGSMRNYSGMIGDAIGSDGAVAVNGASTSWMMQGDLTVGVQGRGQLTISDGASVICGNADIGKFAGSSGSVIVDGAGSSWSSDFLMTIGNLASGEGIAGSLTLLNDASVSSGIVGFFGGIFVYRNGEVQGDGTLNATVINFGEVSPGVGPGWLTLNGNYAQVGQLPNQGNRSGRLTIDVAGALPQVEFDVLDVNGEARLGGGLFVNLASGAELPVNGPPLEIMHASAISPLNPTFDVAFLPALPDAFMRVLYSQGMFGGGATVSLIVLPLETILSFNQGSADPEGTPTSAVVADFNDDGLDDLAITLTNGATMPGSMVVLLSVGSGGFGSPIVHYTVGVEPSAIVAGKFDANNSIDLAVTNKGNGVTNGSVLILANDGTGDFAQLGGPIAVGVRPTWIAAGNFNGTAQNGGEIDLVVANEGDNTITRLQNNGAGGYGPIGMPIPVGGKPKHVSPADLDNDRDLDVVIVNNQTGTVMTLLNDGSFNFPVMASYPTGADPTSAAVTDLNNDTFPDVVTTNRAMNSSEGSVSVFVNTGNGSYAPAVNLPIGNQPFAIVAVNLDATANPNQIDFDDDLAVLVYNNGDPQVRILRNDTEGTALALTLVDQASSAPPGAITLVTGDLDGVNGPDLVTINAPSTLTLTGEPTPASLDLFLNQSQAQQNPCLPDISPTPVGDHVVNVSDLLAVINAWGACPAPPANCPADVAPSGGDGQVNVSDLLAVINGWGPCP